MSPHVIPKRKSFGQHFLHEKSIIQKMVNPLRGVDCIVEIGPGDGAITKELIQMAPKKLILIEADRRLLGNLKQQFNRATIIEADAANVDFEEIVKDEWSMISNLPYNAAAAIIMNALRADNPPQKMIVMVQKEQGDRMLGKSGNSLLTTAIRLYAEAKSLGTVGRGSFNPPPHVDSMMLEIIPTGQYSSEENERVMSIARAGFSARRKQLRKNLAPLAEDRKIIDDCLTEMGKINARAEELTTEEWRRLATCLQA